MVTVYKPRFEPGYDWAMPVGDEDPILRLKSRSCGESWEPIWLYMTTTDHQGRPRQPADLPWHGSQALVAKEGARRILEPVLRDDVEWLPAYDSEGENLWLAHACRVIDALDEKRSKVERFQSSGRIMRVQRYVFQAEAVAGVRCFRLQQQPSQMFVTDEVVSTVEGGALHGTQFVPIWSSLEFSPMGLLAYSPVT